MDQLKSDVTEKAHVALQFSEIMDLVINELFAQENLSAAGLMVVPWEFYAGTVEDSVNALQLPTSDS